MESLEQLRGRFEALTDLHALVGTMKALAGVGVHRLDEAARSVAQYYRTVELGLHVVLRAAPEAPPRRARARAARGAIVFGSDHGLCGRFNEDLVEFAAERMAALVRDDRPLRLLAVGARAGSLLELRGHPPEAEFFVPGTPEAATPSVREILSKVDDWRAEGVEEVAMVHQRPRPNGRCRPVLVPLLPVAPRRFRSIEEQPWVSHSLPMFTMAPAALLSALLRQYFFVSVLRALIESIAAENASRLAAMQAAERSLDERGAELLAELRRKRQDRITDELLDIVSGYEALGGAAGPGVRRGR
jgi:F-type H+-transporting ATPase subunit gamma